MLRSDADVLRPDAAALPGRSDGGFADLGDFARGLVLERRQDAFPARRVGNRFQPLVLGLLLSIVIDGAADEENEQDGKDRQPTGLNHTASIAIPVP